MVNCYSQLFKGLGIFGNDPEGCQIKEALKVDIVGLQRFPV